MTPESGAPVLKAILFADLSQYSRLTAAGEDQAVKLVAHCIELFKDNCGPYRGEFVKSMGDGVFVVFESVTDSLDYALKVQEKLAEFATSAPAANRFRIGLHLGEVRRQGGDVFGHAVNLAARVQAVAVPGGVCATEAVYQAARATPGYAFRFAGRQALKNIPEMVAIYHVAKLSEEPGPQARFFSIAVIDGLAVLDSQDGPVTIRSRPVQALIGYLSLAMDFRDLRERIATLLWPDRTPAEAGAALNNCIRAATRAPSEGLDGALVKQSGFVSLDPARVIVDVRRILDELSAGKIDNSLMQRPDWPEAILYGLESMSSLYRAWVKVARYNFRDRAQVTLEHLIGSFDSGEPISKHAATALLALEPSHEGAARCLMRHYIANHNAAAALRAYEALRRTLKEHYGLEPAAETSALAASLSEPVQAKEPGEKAGSRSSVIAIGDFAAASEGIAARTSGFRADLIVNLSKFRELTVIDLMGQPNSSGVDYVLSAECRELGEHTRLFATLVETGTRRVVWSDSFQLTLENWLSVQRQLVGRIAANVEVYLSHDRLSRNLRRLPQDLGVYDAWLRGEYLLLHWSAHSEDMAERLFEQAISEDAAFAPAYASLASVYNSRQFVRPGLPRRPDTLERALELASRAVELDPLDARNLMAVGFSMAMAQRFEQSELHFELASEINPNDPKVIVPASLGLAYAGRIDVAKRLLERASSLTALFPTYLWSHIAIIRFFTGDYEGAIAAAELSQYRIIDTPGWKAAALGRLGRLEERRAAIDELEKSVGIAWAGPARPSRADIVDWFTGVFPIRRESDRQLLSSSIQGA